MHKNREKANAIIKLMPLIKYTFQKVTSKFLKNCNIFVKIFFRGCCQVTQNSIILEVFYDTLDSPVCGKLRNEMLSVMKRYERKDIERLLDEQAAKLGIAPEELQQKVQDSVPLRELLCELVEEALVAARAEESAELRRRQKEGMNRAQAEGVTLGRPSKKSDKRFEKIRALYEKKQISAEDAAKRLHVSVSTFYRWLRQSRSADRNIEE